MDLSGNVALVTGGAVRVGRAVTLGLAAAGADVFVHYNRSAGPAEATAAEAEALGVRAAIGSSNLSDPVRGRRTDRAGDRPHSVRCPFWSTARPGSRTDTLLDADLDGWRRTLGPHPDGSGVSDAGLRRRPPRRSPGGGRQCDRRQDASPIPANGSATSSRRAESTRSPAAAAVALGPRIRVNAVALGVILPPPGESAEYAERLAADLPLRAARVGPIRSLQTVLYLASNDFVTGEIIRVDGGGHLV